MKSRTTRRFRERLAALPAPVREQARAAYLIFQQNAAHPSLYFKKVHATQPVYSARINLDFRAVGVLNANEIVWFWIGSHAEYDKVLRSL